MIRKPKKVKKPKCKCWTDEGGPYGGAYLRSDGCPVHAK